MERRDKRSECVDQIASTESLTTSTESESFETWTLVTDAAKKRPTKTALETGKVLDEEDHVELIEKNDNNKRDNENADDLSDGISIISDNESAGRVSPHALIEESTTGRNFPLIDEVSSTDFEVNVNERQYESLTPPASSRKEIAASSNLETLDKGTTNQDDPSLEEIPRPFLGMGVRGVFYLSIIIALAAFFGKMKYPEWEQLSLSSQISPLTQRIEDLELQNNLLRAEIDLLNKQVNYLSQQKDKMAQKGETRSSYKQDEKQYGSQSQDNPKVWSGADDINFGDPIEVRFKHSSNAYETISKETNSNEQHFDRKMVDKQENSRKEMNSKEFVDQRPKKDERKYDKEWNSYEKQRKYPKSENGKFDYKYPKHENGKLYEREERVKDKREYTSKESFENDNLRKQRKRQWENDNSPEKNHNHKKDKNWKHEDDWHGKMMQHREDSRKKRDQHDSNNWYIERGNSREEARIIETGDH